MLKLLEWNINQWNSGMRIPDFVAKEIKCKSPDIVALIEFCPGLGWDYFQNEMEEAGYSLFLNPDPEVIGVLIAVRESEKLRVVSSPVWKLTNSPYPHYLKVDVNYDNELITIIGTRICVEDSKENDYKDRKKQLDILVKHLNGDKRSIILGDFNNSHIKGREDQDYSEVKQLYNGLVTEYYNYHMMKEEFEKANFRVYTPPGNVNSWGGYIKNDHIVATKGIRVANVDYSWDFTKVHPIYNGLNPNCSKSWKIWREKGGWEKGFPDHAILTAIANI